jgi:hypothetical protein
MLKLKIFYIYNNDETLNITVLDLFLIRVWKYNIDKFNTHVKITTLVSKLLCT